METHKKDNKRNIMSNIILLSPIIAVILTLLLINDNNSKKELVTEVEIANQCKESKCIHDWKVLDKNDSYFSSLVTCKKCGELTLVDYKNHRMKTKE